MPLPHISDQVSNAVDSRGFVRVVCRLAWHEKMLRSAESSDEAAVSTSICLALPSGGKMGKIQVSDEETRFAMAAATPEDTITLRLLTVHGATSSHAADSSMRMEATHDLPACCKALRDIILRGTSTSTSTDHASMRPKTDMKSDGSGGGDHSQPDIETVRRRPSALLADIIDVALSLQQEVATAAAGSNLPRPLNLKPVIGRRTGKGAGSRFGRKGPCMQSYQI